MLALLSGLVPESVRAQDGPARQREPRGLDFQRDGVWRARARRVMAERQAALSRGDFASLNAALQQGAAARHSAAQAFAITGTLNVATVLFRFADTDPATSFAVADYQDLLFGTTAPAGKAFTLRTFYERMSDGVFSIDGDVLGWVTLPGAMSAYTGPATGCPSPFGTCNGIFSAAALTAMQAGLAQALSVVDATTDFGQYDNDGPDGVPNSGDDDGAVDLLLFVHPSQDGACVGPSNNNLWSHRHFLEQSFQTNDQRGNGGGIIITNYTLQSGVGGSTACDASQVMAIGTTAHETGHGLGLPDLYDTIGNDADDSEGVGHWGLMSSGNYAKPHSPAYMEGFSRLQLGWVTVRDLSAAGTYSLGPYTESDTIFRIQPGVSNPRGEYFLIENRQGTSSDSALVGLKGPGLLIWHVDSTKYASNRFFNSVNTGAIHGLWLMQADGANQLRSSVQGIRNRGDAGDPFPGTSGATAFGPGGAPSARLNTGTLPGFYLDSIRQVTPGGAMAFRLNYGTTLAPADTVLGPAVMGFSYSDAIVATGGSPVAMSLSSGSLPPGIIMNPQGVLAGSPTRSGTFNFTVFVRSGVQGVDWPMRLVVGTPTLALDNVVEQLISGGSHLSTEEARYLDLLGNANNRYDVGDFAAWLDATGTVVSASVMRRIMAAVGR